MSIYDSFQTSEAEIIHNKKSGVIYVADFPEKTGKYISVTEFGSQHDTPDLDIKISSKIHLRITYLTNADKISGIEISKVNGMKVEKIHFSTLDFERILQLLSLFSTLDLKAVVNKSVVFDETIFGDPQEVTRILTLIVSDSNGREKLGEFAKAYGFIEVGDVDVVVQKKEAVLLFDKILNNVNDFLEFKQVIGAGKDEEVWQQFFSKNSWILGSDFVDILEERRLDVENITDYLLKSFDGFVDIIELKLPSAPFWTSENMPRSELTAASMQCNRYILQLERKMNSLDFNEKVQSTPIVKPRITLIYGRSQSWTNDQKETYRVLNSSYSNLNIVSYDHLLERAKRMVGILNTKSVTEESVNLDTIPF